jgi:outer membrane protein OmpA-like peptidoglycan-associated protein
MQIGSFRQVSAHAVFSRFLRTTLSGDEIESESRRAIREATMRSSTRMIATAAFTVLLMPAFLRGAEVAAGPSPTVNGDVTVASSADLVGPAMAEPVTAALFEAPMPVSGGMRYGPPKVELFLGYSYLRAVPSSSADNRLAWLNGGSASIAFNFNRYLGIVGDFGGFADSEIKLLGTNPTSTPDSSGKVYTYLFGPRLSFRNNSRVTPFAQVLFGGIHASEVTLSGCTGAACTVLPSEDTFALTAGGGLDIRVRRHFAIRIIQAEYLLTKFENRTTGASASQNDMRLSSGIVFRFGGGPPPPPKLPVAYSCSVNPSGVFPGDTIAVSGMAQNLNPAKTAVYTWTVDGGTVTAGVPGTATITTADLAAGSYTLKGHVSEGEKAGESADCTAPYAVKAYEPPTVSCSANPSSVLLGGTATITATGVSPQNRPLTYTFSSTSGSVSGTGSAATFSAAGAAPGAVTVTCNVADDKGQTASAGTAVTVEAPAVAPQPVTSQLCSIHFERDSRRPSRVDNEAKACLDDIALNLQSSSDAKLAIVGNVSSGESKDKRLAGERAVNTKAYLVGEKGIDSSRIAVYTGSQDGKIVSAVLIPTGATFDMTTVTSVDESAVKAHPRTPVKQHR